MDSSEFGEKVSGRATSVRPLCTVLIPKLSGEKVACGAHALYKVTIACPHEHVAIEYACQQHRLDLSTVDTRVGFWCRACAELTKVSYKARQAIEVAKGTNSAGRHAGTSRSGSRPRRTPRADDELMLLRIEAVAHQCRCRLIIEELNLSRIKFIDWG